MHISPLQHTNPFYTGGWNGLPHDLIREITDKFHIKDICKMSVVCKAWQEAVVKSNYGTHMLAKLGLTPGCGNWMNNYFHSFVNAPHVIALDISGSMSYSYADGLRRKDMALKLIADICNKLADPILHRGVDCILFNNLIDQDKFFSIDDVMDFFENKGQLTFGGTDIYKLFNHLARLQCRYQNEFPGSSCQVTIISDFDAPMAISPIARDGLSMSVQCLNLGSRDALGNVLLSFDQWADAQAEIKFKAEIDAMQLEERMAIEPIGKPGRRAADGTSQCKKRKRTTNTIEREYESNVSFVEQQLDKWQPLLKKRKIRVSSTI
jgi:hypothetical protein